MPSNLTRAEKKKEKEEAKKEKKFARAIRWSEKHAKKSKTSEQPLRVVVPYEEAKDMTHQQARMAEAKSSEETLLETAFVFDPDDGKPVSPIVSGNPDSIDTNKLEIAVKDAGNPEIGYSHVHPSMPDQYPDNMQVIFSADDIKADLESNVPIVKTEVVNPEANTVFSMRGPVTLPPKEQQEVKQEVKYINSLNDWAKYVDDHARNAKTEKDLDRIIKLTNQMDNIQAEGVMNIMKRLGVKREKLRKNRPTKYYRKVVLREKPKHPKIGKDKTLKHTRQK
jgi:Asp-tRNA(Asn)/Glu-tRNA(Gln) amidotransferase C subunit